MHVDTVLLKTHSFGVQIMQDEFLPALCCFGPYMLAWYAFACAATAADQPDDALRYLQESVNRGLRDADALATDDDLKNLRSNPKFQQLIAELKRPVASTQVK